jgi:precorrin-2 methylase
MSRLYVVATPIGNLEDVTLRALRVLREVSIVAAEDTRTARILLSHHGIKARLVSYTDHNKAPIPELLDHLDEEISRSSRTRARLRSAIPASIWLPLHAKRDTRLWPSQVHQPSSRRYRSPA